MGFSIIIFFFIFFLLSNNDCNLFELRKKKDHNLKKLENTGSKDALLEKIN